MSICSIMIYEKALQTVTYFRADVIMCQFSSFIFKAAINGYHNVYMVMPIESLDKICYHFHIRTNVERQMSSKIILIL